MPARYLTDQRGLYQYIVTGGVPNTYVYSVLVASSSYEAIYYASQWLFRVQLYYVVLVLSPSYLHLVL
jgi:hypothetical protein